MAQRHGRQPGRRGGWRLGQWLGRRGRPSAPPALAAAQEPGQQVWEALCRQAAQRILAVLGRQRLLLDEMQAAEQDPGRLEQLLELDQQMMLARRRAENLAILAGHPSPDTTADRVASVHTLILRARSAVGAQHGRVDIGPVVQLAVLPAAAGAAGRVLTELLDNALRYSPPHRRVSVSAHVTADGAVLVRVQDTGLGFETPRIELINFVLAGPPPSLVDWQAHQTGFAVAHREAHRHGLQIRLHPVQTPTDTPAGTAIGTGAGTVGGTVVTVLLPAPVVCEVPISPDAGPATSTGRSLPLRPGPAGGWSADGWPTAGTARVARPDTRPGLRPGTGQPATASVPASAGPADSMPAGTGQLPRLPTRHPAAPETSGAGPAMSKPAGDGRPPGMGADRPSLATRQQALVDGLTDWPTAASSTSLSTPALGSPPTSPPTAPSASPSGSLPASASARSSASASWDGQPTPEGRRL
jgi:hypothetical protein